MASKRENLNAMKHGLYAREVVLPWEDAKKFEAFKQAIRDELGPDGPLEEEAVREIAELHWRKQRLALGYLLRFYKSPPPPDLVEAANGGLASLAAYLQAEAQRRPDGNLVMTGARMIDYVKSKLGTRGDAGDHHPHPKDVTSGPQPDTGIARGVVECAYDPAAFDQLLKIEVKIDSRIARTMARLVWLKEYKKLYRPVPASVPAVALPLVTESPAVQPAPQSGNPAPETGESNKTKPRRWGDPD